MDLANVCFFRAFSLLCVCAKERGGRPALQTACGVLGIELVQALLGRVLLAPTLTQ